MLLRLLLWPALFLMLSTSPAMADSQKAAKIIVHKAARKLDLLDNDSRLLKSYVISLGGNPIGHKTQSGDEKTPEGSYIISGRNPTSSYHLSLRISYPNEQDAAQAAKRGVSPGGDIMIHGIRGGLGWVGTLHRRFNWTQGCIAVTNAEIEEIWSLVPDGTPIEIRP